MKHLNVDFINGGENKKKGNIKITFSNFKALLSSEHCENLGTKVLQQLRGCVSLLLFICLSLPASGLRAKPMPRRADWAFWTLNLPLPSWNLLHGDPGKLWVGTDLGVCGQSCHCPACATGLPELFSRHLCTRVGAAWLRLTFCWASWRTSATLQLQAVQPLVLQPASKRLGASAAWQKAGCNHTGLCKHRSRDHLPPGRAGSLPCCPHHGLARLPQFPALALAKDALLPDPCSYGLGQP